MQQHCVSIGSGLLVLLAVAGCEAPALTQIDDTVSVSPTSLISKDVIADVDGPRVSDRFPNILLTDQYGQEHHFYEDLVQDRSVCIVFFYTNCTGSCPGTTQALERLRHEMEGEFGSDDFLFLSLTLEPEVDTPEELQAYIDRFHLDMSPQLPRWLYCTGDFGELDDLRRSLGVYDLDPIIDADKTEHAAIITFGNDRLDRWAALPSGLKTSDLKETVLRISGNTQYQRFKTILAMHASMDDDDALSNCRACCKCSSSSDSSE